MEIGVTFPRDGLKNDTAAFRDFVQAAEGLGYRYVYAGDHVVGSTAPHPIAGEEASRPIVDPFVLFSYLAACTREMGFVTGVMVLPQRQTVLVAKQAASLDVICGGRFILGVAVGWNETEYVVLNEDFHNRGRRMDEQIQLMRALWTRDSVDFDGQWHHVHQVGINPRPVRQPIPIYIGAYAESGLRRVAKYADGWFVQNPPETRAYPEPEESRPTIERLHTYLRAEGRDPAAFGMNAGVRTSIGSPDDWRQRAHAWRDLGVTMLTVNTTMAEPTLDQHIAAIQRFATEVMGTI